MTITVICPGIVRLTDSCIYLGIKSARGGVLAVFIYICSVGLRVAIVVCFVCCALVSCLSRFLLGVSSVSAFANLFILVSGRVCMVSVSAQGLLASVQQLVNIRLEDVYHYHN